jgi:oligosaccharide repeat unit polymerase
MKNYLLKIIYWAPIVFIIFIIFIFPFIFSSFFYTYNVFELLKAAFLWPIALIIFLLTLFKIWIFQINIRNYINNNFLFLIGFLILFLLFNTFYIANNYELALFGDYNRRQGLFTQLSYLLIFSLTIFNLIIINNLKKIISYCLFLISFSGFLVALYGFIQYIGFDYFIWQETVIASRVISSIGQPNFLASFLLLSLGVSFAGFFKFKNFYFRLFFLVSIFLQLLTIYLSSSRSAFFSIILVFILALLILIKKRKNKLIFIFTTIISVIISLLLLINFYPDSRLSQSFNLNEGSIWARKNFYNASLDIIKEKPLLGHGLEQAGNRFVTYYKPDWALFSKVNDYPDRAHNIILDLIINFGMVGLLIYGFLFLYLFYVLLIKIKEKEKYLLFIYLGILAYIISLMFGFSSLSTSLYFWILLALLLPVYFYKLRREDNEKFLLAKNLKFIIIFCLLISIFCLYISLNNSIKTIKADQKFLICHNSLVDNNLNNFYYCWQALDLSDDASQRNYYYVTIINYYIDKNYLFDQNFKSLFDSYLMNLYPKLNKNDYELLFTQAKMACYLKKDDYEKVFKSLINYSPKRPAVYYSQANCYSYLNKPKKAINSYNLALSFLPDIYDARINKEHQDSLKKYKYLIFYGLGQSQALIENYQEALEYFKQAYYNNPEDINVFKNIGQANYLLGNYHQAIDNYLLAFGKDKNNYYWPLMIYQIYNELGDNEKADLYLKKYNHLINN